MDNNKVNYAEVFGRLMMILTGFVLVMLGFITFIHTGEHKVLGILICKMEKLKLGLKSYRYFDQAKALADKLGIALNEGILNESSSMALSVYSPENLASLLEDKVEQTREEKIAIARSIMQQATVN